MISRDTINLKPNALKELVQDAIRAGLTVEHDTNRVNTYIIEGIRVWDNRFITVNFGRVRKLIEEKMK